MVVDDPTPTQGQKPMTRDGLARSADTPVASGVADSGVAADAAPAPLRPLGGKRISLVAWGLAGVAGIAIWALLIRFV